MKTHFLFFGKRLISLASFGHWNKTHVHLTLYIPAVMENSKPLTYMHQTSILMHMRTTLIIDEELVNRARELTGIQEKTALVREGLKALIARESARWLAAQGGTQPKLRDIPRRRLA